MDRDNALLLLQKLGSIKAIVDDVVTKVKVLTRKIPVIIQQPEKYVGPAGGNAVFTVIAENVAAYQWQTKKKDVTNWSNSGLAGNKTNTIKPSVTTVYTQYEYRCKMTGIDNTIIYSDIVDITIEEE